jgi:hypothetical protein
MSAYGWIATGHRLLVAPFLRLRIKSHRPVARRRAAPRLESLEPINLMSRGLAPLAHVAPHAPATPVVAEVATFAPSVLSSGGPIHSLTAVSTSATQTTTVPDTLTNFVQAFGPAVNLFNPNLGTLVDVKVVVAATLTSVITSENTSTTSPADITGTLMGSVQVTGLPNTVTGNVDLATSTVHVPAYSGNFPPFQGPTTVNFPPLTQTTTKTFDYTDAANLAFFTSSPGHTTVTPVLTATGTAGASAPNGNLQTIVRTSGSGVVAITFDYIPSQVSVVKLVRFGIHQQPTVLQVTYSGQPVPAEAGNPGNYTIVIPNSKGSFTGPGVVFVPVSYATYDATNHVATLVSSKRLNFHKIYQLRINLPSTNPNTIVIEFGGTASLGGFLNKQGQFVPVVNGVPLP